MLSFNKCFDMFLYLLNLFIIILIITNVNLGNAVTHTGIKAEPIFLTQSEAFKFAVGDVITLPCEVAQPGSYVLAWKRGIAILTAGTVKVSPDPRVRLVNGNQLQIRDAVPQDAGDYICQIATLDPREITHHVEILIPPKIHHVTSGGHLQVKKGSPVRLECNASGNPIPNITWTRKNNVLPNGENQYVSPVYTIENMDRHKGGIYICTANNGINPVANSQIILHVLFPPEITIEKPIVYSGEQQEAQLVCIVHGETPPDVQWFRDTMQIDTNEQHTVEHRGARHTLIIHRVNSRDFGNYSCVADNQLGKSRKIITLSGKPLSPAIQSPPIGQWKDRYNISWKVESFSPIEEYKLNYRVVPNTLMGHPYDSEPSNLHDNNRQYNFDRPNYKQNFDNKDQSQFNSFAFHNTYGNMLQSSHDDWQEVVLPATSQSYHNFCHLIPCIMSYMIRNLEPDQQYEARVQSRNRYGWSDFSEDFQFTTSSSDMEIKDLGVTYHGTEHNNGNRMQSIKIPILLIFNILAYLVK